MEDFDSHGPSTLFETIWGCRWLLDGAADFDAAIAILRQTADFFAAMKAAGVEFDNHHDDYLFLRTSDPAVAEQFGFTAVEEEDEDCGEDAGEEETTLEEADAAEDRPTP
jgi:hypothetical protein